VGLKFPSPESAVTRRESTPIHSNAGSVLWRTAFDARNTHFSLPIFLHISFPSSWIPARWRGYLLLQVYRAYNAASSSTVCNLRDSAPEPPSLGPSIPLLLSGMTSPMLNLAARIRGDLHFPSPPARCRPHIFPTRHLLLARGVTCNIPPSSPPSIPTWAEQLSSTIIFVPPIRSLSYCSGKKLTLIPRVEPLLTH